MTNVLYVSDLHLTDNVADDYRWCIFDFIKSVQVNNRRIDHLFILGDVTDFKNRHSSILVNRIVSEITKLSLIFDVHIIMGNHDYENPDQPFFDFLNNIQGVFFYKKGCIVSVEDALFYCVPHSRLSFKERADFKFKNLYNCDVALFHETFKGAFGSNGFELDGTSTNLFRDFRKTILLSGDIHVPQKVGVVEYVGSPYPVRYGDTYQPRVLLHNLESGVLKSIETDFIRKESLKVDNMREVLDRVEDLGLIKGDMLKIKVRVPVYKMLEWPSVRKNIVDFCVSNSIVLGEVRVIPTVRRKLVKGVNEGVSYDYNLAPSNIIKSFGKSESLNGDYMDEAKELM